MWLMEATPGGTRKWAIPFDDGDLGAYNKVENSIRESSATWSGMIVDG